MSANLIDEITQGIIPVVAPLTVQQYHTMIDSGILEEGAAIELIDGLLVRKDRRDQGGDIMTVGPRHAVVVSKLASLLVHLLQNIAYHARIQQPVTLEGVSEPEPDGCIVKGNIEEYTGHHPGPAEIVLAVEVSESSLEYDRTTKQRIYATAGIPAYWIVNLRDDTVEIFDHPSPTKGRYDGHYLVKKGDDILLQIDQHQLVVPVSDLL